VRRLDAVIFDLDGTLVRYRDVDFESSWGAIAVAAGVGEAASRLLESYLPRRDAYPEWVREQAHLLAGVPVRRVEAEIFPPPYARGVPQAIEALRREYVLGILSSGVSLVADRVADDLGLSFAWANRLDVEDGCFTGTSHTLVDLWSKADALRQLAEERAWSLDRICFVGDHINDLPVLRKVGLAVAANPKDDALAAAVDHVIHDFEELPRLIRAFENA
jgi:phosphoserine phosphatase